jgi:hypothetical protein
MSSIPGTLDLVRGTCRWTISDAVYIVALDTSSRRAESAGESLELERRAREEFAKEKKFKIAPVFKSADFVFVIAIDRDARDSDEVAIAISPGDYRANGASLEKMREAAFVGKQWSLQTRKARCDCCGICRILCVLRSLIRRQGTC